VRTTFVVLLAIMAPRRSGAQELARWHAFAGYSTINDITDQEAFPLGWVVGASGHLNRWLSVVVDVDGQYKTIPSIDTDIRLTSHAITGGPRVQARLGRFIEFGQVLVGVVRAENTLFGFTGTDTHAVLQAGVGLDYPMNGKWAIRGELDVRSISTNQEIRVATGIVRAFR
jgi:outer membrane protein with beta-barrel domain